MALSTYHDIWQPWQEHGWTWTRWWWTSWEGEDGAWGDAAWKENEEVKQKDQLKENATSEFVVKLSRPSCERWSLHGKVRPYALEGLTPSEDDRAFIAFVNHICAVTSSAGFGSTGAANDANQHVACKVIDFAQVASSRASDLGKFWTTRTRGNCTAVDVECPFWRIGQKRYLDAMIRYFSSLCRVGASLSASALPLLGDLGFHVYEDFITEQEETELFCYWSPSGSVHALGSCEAATNRRFFHYGPVLLWQTRDSRKSTLGVVPARLGAMPDIVEGTNLRHRIREAARGLGDRGIRLDQMYVNRYVANRSRIDFHHDNPKSMQGLVAGVSLGASCEMQLVGGEAELTVPIRVLLPRRSLYLMRGISRYHLQHGIPVMTGTRVSLTFRTVNLDSADRAMWRREWQHIPSSESRNAHWPLLPPSAEPGHGNGLVSESSSPNVV